MKRRILQTVFGLGVGIAVCLVLPGHHGVGMARIVSLSLAGSMGAELAAEWLMPPSLIARAGFFACALGALAVLLVYALAVQTTP